MGIQNFHKHIKATYPSAIEQFTSKTYGHLYVDVNYALHVLSYNVNSLSHLYNRLICYIKRLYDQINPITITLACDGPASFAKLTLQKKRRTGVPIDSLQLNFTPGTEFMNNLFSKIESVVQLIDAEFTMLSSSEPDEAEHKIIKQILINHNSRPSSHVVITNDADVIVMLSAITDRVRSIETKLYTLSNNQLINVNEIVYQFTLSTQQPLHSNLDFAFLSILLGNDYIPKIAYANPQILFNVYCQTMNDVHMPIIVSNNNTLSFNQHVLLTFFRILTTTITIKQKHPSTNNAELYLQGVIWCLQSYVTGEMTNYSYIYHGKSPHASQLSRYCEINPLPNHPPPSEPLSIQVYRSLISEYGDCAVCQEYANQITKTKTTINTMQLFNGDSTKLEEQLDRINEQYTAHKETHT